MRDLSEDKKKLKKTLGEKGITHVLKYLKEILPSDVPKYDVLIQIEGEYRDVKMKMLEGLLNQQDIGQANAKIRRRLIDLINSLEPEDFTRGVKGSQFEEQGDIKKGHILYQVPDRMKLYEDTRCLVRIAFDKATLVADIDLTADTEFRSDVRISDYMKVELVDPASSPVFEIRSTSEPVQFIDIDDYTEWRFYVKPLIAGKHVLELKVNLILLINDREVIREKTLEESVVIITEDVTDSSPVFKQMEETFITSDLRGANPPAAPGGKGIQESGARAKKSETIPADSGSKRSGASKSVRMMTFLLAGVFAISASYAFIPSLSQEVDWLMVNKMQNSEAGYTRFISKYEKKLPTSDLLETAHYKKAVVQNSPEAMREYIKTHPKSRYQEEATWELAERTNDPIDYLDYADRFQKTPRTKVAKQKVVKSEELILDKVKAQKDSNGVQLLDKYLRVAPERKKSELLKPVIKEIEPVIRDTKISRSTMRNLSPVLELNKDSQKEIKRENN